MEHFATQPAHVIGLDFGSDSVRALLVNAVSGEEVASGVTYYPRWMQGLYNQPEQSQFRHHPKDYIEAMTQAVREALAAVPAEVVQSVVGIGVDTTGSTPAPIDAEGNVLALRPEFEHNPHAMFILWKDHTSVVKAERINQLAHSGDFTDYTKFIGGIYSSEWFWAKAAWVSEQDADVAKHAYSWVELCDWIPALLSGNQHPHHLRRGICAAGHKAMWHESWGGLPDQAFLSAISPTLDGMRERMFSEVYTAEQQAGTLSSEWAQTLGLPEGIAVAVGEFDCHMGAVGAGAGAHDLVKVIGTSTCDILMVDADNVGERTIHGICGQVKGSALPNLMALEAGQSAFGDIYAWYKRVLLWPLQALAEQQPEAQATLDALDKALIPLLSQAAESYEFNAHSPLAMDWHNGRRTPYANQRLKGSLSDLNLGSSAPALFAALVESTAHGAKAIVDCFVDQGMAVERVIAIGGISQKSPYVMQMCADVIGRDIAVVRSEQCCALGAAIFAAVAAGVYDNARQAQAAMASPISAVYTPNADTQTLRRERYAGYRELGQHLEQLAEFHQAKECNHE
ncbi:ribulokinase [Vibrio fluvialis]|uniref:ribulokinase n=1 Tax=Vibrio fluvialis TaxID=676 RepID=UPI001BAF3D54|nr:ribulokinase [Vibrio fluvialis]EKO3501611.1 ribulokinase [Vibrio fluvialis]EKO3510445.1 ribulokinase [Vibrio fluvialis]EKO3971532.1 ribulokinase [Vibrio fluvialis]EKZ9002453.1 ribulokinase [Vibrio fluvialis]ELI1831111.1 ribulokinase [Vibrio fluvialis]